MLRHRLCKFGYTAFFALCMLFTGVSTSCTDELDDYKYDDEYPAWLGASIYDFLKDGNHNGRTYNTLVAIIDSLDYDDVLSRTGSKTLFVADDDAFARFFQDNRWGVTCIEDMSRTQMKILLFGSMLDNTYLLDMMSCLPAEGNGDPVEGTCLRRETSLKSVDSVPYFTPDMLPTYNKNWDKFRAENGGEGLYLAVDATEPMMVHFLQEYIKAKGLTELDINVIFNAPHTTKRSGEEAFIYQNQIIASDVDYGDFSDDTLTITCKNGFVYRMNNVLLPPSNMAEELRQHPKTQIFSHILERFSVPVYAGDIFNNEYNYIQNRTDNPVRVYERRYVNSSNERPLSYLDANGDAVVDGSADVNSLLLYDPGWNQYISDATAKPGADMAAMLAPTDKKIYEYFAKESGKFLLTQFAPDAELNDNDYMSILPALDSIPQHIIATFVRDHMLESFYKSVPSKFEQVTDGAKEPMGLEPGHVDECVVANNGVIYILNNVFGPAEYRSVSAPPLIMDNMLIMQEAITQLGYNAYLLAMKTTYSFIVPDNDYFIYYDPVTIKSPTPVAYRFFAERVSDEVVDISAKAYRYDTKTYELLEELTITYGGRAAEFVEEGQTVSISDVASGTSRSVSFSWGQAGSTSPAGFLRNRFTDLLDYLIVLGEVEDGNKYHLSKGYGSVKCEINTGMVDVNGELMPEAITFYGGEQIENGTAVKVLERYPEENGVTYCTKSENDNTNRSGIPTPPTQTLYYKLDPNTSVNSEFTNFFNLCYGPDEISMLELFERMYPNADSDSLQSDSVKRYSIFYGSTSKTVGRNVPRDYAVPFFTSYHYTVYVPTNDAISKAYEMGLPTWEELVAELAVEEDSDDSGEEEDDALIPSPAKAKKVAAYIRLINKFVRYHFQDNSVFVDENPFSIPSSEDGLLSSANYETAAINDATGRFFELTLATTGGANGETLGVTDNLGRLAKVVNIPEMENQSWNVMTRDLLLWSTTALPENGTSIETSSFATVHQIDSCLLNSDIVGYDGKFRRYADDGEPIDTMTVVGINGPHAGKFIVGNVGMFEMPNEDGTESYKRLGYIMRKTGSTNKMSMEEYVVNESGEKILIDNSGYLCEKVYDEATGKHSYGYVVDENGSRVRVNSNGQVIP